MSITLQRRLDRLEHLVNQVANPVGPRETILLAVPPDDASPEAKATFEAGCQSAAERGASVIGLVGVRPTNPNSTHAAPVVVLSDVD